MPDEKLNDINEVQSGSGVTLGPLHPSAVRELADALPRTDSARATPRCWCGASVGPLIWGDRLWCEACLPRAGRGHAKLRDVPIPSGPVEQHRTLLRIEALLSKLLEAVTPRKDPAAPSALMPLQPGDRASYNGRRGVLRSIGVAGTGILYDDGRYALLTNAMAAKLVRE